MKKANSAKAAVTMAAALAAFSAQALGDEAAAPVKNRTIGYVLTSDEWALYSTEKATECPKGLNDGPREQYAVLYPNDGTKRSVIDTDLKREAEIWFPTLEPDQFEFREAAGKIAPGINLDGKVGPNDFVGPDGEAGIDNQFYRAMGCIADYRPGGFLRHFSNVWMKAHNYTRVLIELTEVDDLVNDDDVTIGLYRGSDPLLTDATGNDYVPGGAQRIDQRWGKKFQARFKGKITNGVLTTEAADMTIPYIYTFDDRSFVKIRGGQFKLKLTPDQANGYWGGYIDIESWYRALIGAVGTNTLSFGRQAAASMYRAYYKLADAYPDAKTGRNTAISGAKDVQFRQAYIIHPNQRVASQEEDAHQAAAAQKLAANAAR